MRTSPLFHHIPSQTVSIDSSQSLLRLSKMWWIILYLVLSPLHGLSINRISRRSLCQRSIITISTGICTGCLGGNSVSIVNPSYAAYTREVGGSDKSPEQAAYNIQVGLTQLLHSNPFQCFFLTHKRQAQKTNERLERSGFKLDTKEEETARLSDALGSYTYEPSGSGTKGKNGISSSKSNSAVQRKKIQ
jgi:hypothetical protein